MAFVSLSQQNRVLYACSCNLLSPFGEMFFCRWCRVLRCQECVTSTVDVPWCPCCAENSVIASLVSKKNTCSRCFECPQCTTTLSLRTVVVSSEGAGDHSLQTKQPSADTTDVSKVAVGARSPRGTKLYYLLCSYCKWSTRDIGVKDKRSPVDFRERTSPNQKRIDDLLSYYKEFASNEVSEREQLKKALRRARSHSGILDSRKFISSRMQGFEGRIPAKRADFLTPTWDVNKIAAVAGDAEALPDSLYTDSIDVNSITTIEQRMLDPVFQPVLVSQFLPRPLHMIGKRMHRCKACEHIIVKAEISPLSIRFKVQQIAWLIVPQIKIAQLPDIKGGSTHDVIISVSNPTLQSMDISFSECTLDIQKHLKEKLVQVVLPVGTFALPPKDDMLEPLAEEEKTTSEFVVKKIGGKLFIKIPILLETREEIVNFAFILTFTYTAEASEAGNVQIPIIVRAGKLSW